MGIVHHAEYLKYFEVGRVEWLRRRGITFASWTTQGIHLPVVLATLTYRAPARFDDSITVETRLAELRWASVRYTYAITRGTDLLVSGETRLACVDASNALRRIPPEVLATLAGAELDSPSAARAV